MKTTETNYANLKKAYIKYLKISKNVKESFGGPSLYFHNKALQEREKDFLGDVHIEAIYATLTAWGMHRMGDTNTKMVEFSEFKKSILNQKKQLTELKDLRLEKIKSADLDDLIARLKTLCFDLKVSQSNSLLVGNSKTLAHILPNLVPPIDRQYTIRFFTKEPREFIDNNRKYRTISNFKNIEAEKECFAHILNKTYDFVNHIKSVPEIKIEKSSDTSFNTSLPKIFDNLIITYVKKVKKQYS